MKLVSAKSRLSKAEHEAARFKREYENLQLKNTRNAGLIRRQEEEVVELTNFYPWGIKVWRNYA